jgi:hypothetical protein
LKKQGQVARPALGILINNGCKRLLQKRVVKTNGKPVTEGVDQKIEIICFDFFAAAIGFLGC